MEKTRLVLVPGLGARIAAAAAVGVAALSAQAGIVPQPRMGDPLPGLTQSQLIRFQTGKVTFDHDFTVPEGLGPIFNQAGCGSCHNNPLGGPGTITVTRAGHEDKNGFDPLAELGGSLFQQEAISEDCAEVLPPGANLVELRITNGMMGYGLAEAIPDAAILFYETNPPSGNVSGRVNWVESFEDPGNPRVGRFGWKAQVATILTFSADASLNELGITTPFLPQENDPNGINPPDLGDPDFCDTVADPEADTTFLQELTDFQRFLAQPPQTPRSGMSGEAIFSAIGCTDCHVPSFTTTDDPMLEDALRNKAIRPYSDFLLHDMGLTGSVIDQGYDEQREVKTPPLWGLLRHDPIWHDGRFTGSFSMRVPDAIAAHDVVLSEGQASAQAYAALTTVEQSQVLAFLASLGRREFDSDGDDDVDLNDFVSFAACHGGGPYTPDDPCAVHDIDQNGDVDFTDFALFLSVYAGPQEDCNGNSVLDLLDMLNGTSDDLNGNAIPDECECPADSDGDGSVGINDLLDLLAAWGPNPGHPADIDGDGTVGINDLLDLLAAWGPCL
jgi:cytochrome c551/c552